MNVAAAALKKLAGMSAATTLLLLGTTPIAHATPTDDFVRQVRANGIGLNVSDASLVEDAQEVCDMLDYQESAYQYLDQHSGLNRNQSAFFVAASVTYYCPQYAPKLGPGH
ncbi:DUF732 domain-containing protein [Mycobacterium sherrisii]|uniref:DUF732 domain-containing protein n=1 Tax=Mycobacterium sherrisii TaxID=243061 RepID=A0A1E3T093_9MYCO|nr:DUF732 domain-containing protein [Mycobacterium sherrisii]MCV7031122.1 DUF732 domain-containing protein [Mycobacterium sherrisii]MEC4761692.1 DUF732 domain-containing protein [Mycobacterium sherrisii]ODR07238.1 hypothetical protein BHQ21_09255 [Mycobacterium sherrisii]ORW73588.1 hypothetical protein AWC25_17710 [Mycobacterium sherrisii]